MLLFFWLHYDPNEVERANHIFKLENKLNMSQGLYTNNYLIISLYLYNCYDQKQ